MIRPYSAFDLETANPDQVTYTKEELAENVKVPPLVEQDLKRIISDRLEQCGLYFRVFSRIKTAASMESKFERKDYNASHKLQDLIGVRINLYFDDDVPICQNIMANTFDVVNWSTSKREEDEFKPAKLNGVFRLPGYLKQEISPQTWDMCIDDTFEIQIKTMFFEGWHEVEHDMRYKGEELWRHYPGFSRYFNSILATLELCDKSMVTLFEDLGHALYKSGRWSDMVKSHFRLKLGEAQLYPEVEKILNDDMVNTDNLAKKIFRTPRPVLIGQLLSRQRRIPINVNTIIALLNDSVFHDERLKEVFSKRDVYNDGREETDVESRHYELRPLTRHTVFQMKTIVDGSRLKSTEAPSTPVIYDECCSIIYRWVQQKYGDLFHDFPDTIQSFHAEVMAFNVTVKYHPEVRRLKVHARHIDPEVGGRVWFTEVNLYESYDGTPSCGEEVSGGRKPDRGEMPRADAAPHIFIETINGYAEPDREDMSPSETPSRYFSYPAFYKNIVDNVGIINGLPCSGRRRILRDEQIGQVVDAISGDREFPIVLIISREDENGMMDEDWLLQFRVSDFTRTVWRYAHVLCCYEKTGRELLRRVGDIRYNSEPQVPRLYIFWPDGSIDDYGAEDVMNCSFGRHLEARDDARTYDIVHGGQAFYHRIVTDLRDYNVSANMWDGFKLDTQTGIPD